MAGYAIIKVLVHVDDDFDDDKALANLLHDTKVDLGGHIGVTPIAGATERIGKSLLPPFNLDF